MLTGCDGTKARPHAPLAYDQAKSFCPACEFGDDLEKLKEEVAALKGIVAVLEQGREEMSKRVAEISAT